MKRLALLLCSIVWACGSGDRLEAPELHLGDQACEACAMAVADARVAAAMIVESEDGRRALIFDDIGCLLTYERSHPDTKPLARYVRDYAGDRWLALESATFLHSDTIPTPMRYGTVAFASMERAQATRAERGGVVLGPEALR